MSKKRDHLLCPSSARILDHDDLVRALADRRKMLGLSQIDVDCLAGWADGYCGKLEAGVGGKSPRSSRGLGRESLTLALETLGVGLILVSRTPSTSEQIENECNALAAPSEDFFALRAQAAARARWAKASEVQKRRAVIRMNRARRLKHRRAVP